MSSTGTDLRFADADESRVLNYEIEEWDVNGNSVVWVQVPALTNGTYIWAYWGYSNALVAPSYTMDGSTWSEGYEAVWHLHDDYSDATGNRGDAVNYGSSDTIGLAADAQDFNGTSDRIDLGFAPNWYRANIHQLTVTAWAKPDTDNGKGTVWGSESVLQGNGLAIKQGSRGKWSFAVMGDSIDDPLQAMGVWQQLALVLDQGQSRGYLNGDAPKIVGAHTWFTPGFLPLLGYLNGVSNSAFHFDGKIDEVRISSIVRSDDWIAASWKTAGANDSFVTNAPVEDRSPFDVDGDGMGDVWEVNHLGGTNAQPDVSADPDPHSNLEEYISGTDPTDGESFFSLHVTNVNGRSILRFLGRRASGSEFLGFDRFYDLFSSSNLLTGPWLPIPGRTNLMGEDAVISYTNAPADRTQFYRAETWLD
jgi:hypothetical protein